MTKAEKMMEGVKWGRVAFLFAGQGAQVPGMAADVKDLPKVKKLFDLAESIRPGTVEKMLCGTQEELNRTLLTQPTMFLADLAYAYAKEEEIGTPECVCGFSVGEVPALCFAECFPRKTRSAPSASVRS